MFTLPRRWLCAVALVCAIPCAHARLSKAASAAAEVKALQQVIQGYKAHHGAFPTAEQGIQALKLPVELKDPWGNPFHYRLAGTRSKDGFEVFSAGPDGKPGTNDDIGNW